MWFFSVFRDAGRKFFMFAATVVSVGIFVFHLYQFSKIKNFKKKNEDWKAAIYGLAGFAITTIGTVGFGKPYSPVDASMIAGVAFIAVCKPYPGMYDWMDKLILVCTTVVYLLEYYRNVYSSRRRDADE